MMVVELSLTVHLDYLVGTFNRSKVLCLLDSIDPAVTCPRSININIVDDDVVWS
jgi:hypothetical protein